MESRVEAWKALNSVQRCVLCGERGMCNGQQRKDHARAALGTPNVQLGVTLSIKALTELLEKL